MKALELVYIDLCGPMRTKVLNGELYFLLFIDYNTRMAWVFFLKKKYEAFECFKIFKEIVENEADLKIKCLRSNDKGEYTSNEFEDLCEKMEQEDRFKPLEPHNKMGW